MMACFIDIFIAFLPLVATTEVIVVTVVEAIS
jgi:hypothetical protein